MTNYRLPLRRLEQAARHSVENSSQSPRRQLAPSDHSDFWAAKLRNLRKDLGLTQPQFAERYSIEIKALQNWEQSIRYPDPSSRVIISMIEADPKTTAQLIVRGRLKIQEMA